MSQVQAEGRLYFVPPAQDDIVSYDLYWRRPGQTWECGEVRTSIEPERIEETGQMCINLALYDVMVEGQGFTEFSVAAVDDAGNVSDTSDPVLVNFNLRAPAKPLHLDYKYEAGE